MDSRGVLFSAMALILLGSLLALYLAASSEIGTISSNITEMNNFRKVSDKYSNIMNNFTNLAVRGKELEVDQRILPFSYSADYNSFSLEFELPARESLVESYLENLNAFRVFLEDSSPSNEFDFLPVDINTLSPESWGGGDSNVSFLIEPQGMRLAIRDDNSITLDFPSADGNYLSLRKQEISFVPGPSADFNAVSCSFNSEAICMGEDFNSLDPRPYVRILLLDENCFSCALPIAEISGHFDPSLGGFVEITCSGASCISDSVGMDFSGATAIRQGSPRSQFSISLEFGSEITAFTFRDANLSVSDYYTQARRWN